MQKEKEILKGKKESGSILTYFERLNSEVLLSEFNYSIGNCIKDSIGGLNPIINVDVMYIIADKYLEMFNVNYEITEDEFKRIKDSIYCKIELFSNLYPSLVFIDKKTSEETYIKRRSNVINFLNNVDTEEYVIKYSDLDRTEIDSSNGEYFLLDRLFISKRENSLKEKILEEIHFKSDFEEFHERALSVLRRYTSKNNIAELQEKELL